MKCTATTKSVGFFRTEKNRINTNPPYQRESGAWSNDKKQLLIDSLLNYFDTPKIYLHDLYDEKDEYIYAVIDGKQRLSTIWEFLNDEFALGNSFKFSESVHDEKNAPKGGDRYSDFSDSWKERFRDISLSITEVKNAEEEDIEELFQRLNNGETLSSAEKRNAFGGDMCSLIRDVAEHKYFKEYVTFKNKKYSHYEVSAKLLRIEENTINGGLSRFCEIKKQFLDNMVRNNKTMSDENSKKLISNVTKNLDLMTKVFQKEDPLLKKLTITQLYYIGIGNILSKYAHEKIYGKLQEFFTRFNKELIYNYRLDENEQNIELSAYQNMSQHSTNDPGNMELRYNCLEKYFLLWNDDVAIKDLNRRFSDEERYVLWKNSNEKCTECDRKIEFKEVDADHVDKYSHGGQTILSNGRCKCQSCNRSDNSHLN